MIQDASTERIKAWVSALKVGMDIFIDTELPAYLPPIITIPLSPLLKNAAHKLCDTIGVTGIELATEAVSAGAGITASFANTVLDTSKKLFSDICSYATGAKTKEQAMNSAHEAFSDACNEIKHNVGQITSKAGSNIGKIIQEGKKRLNIDIKNTVQEGAQEFKTTVSKKVDSYAKQFTQDKDKSRADQIRERQEQNKNTNGTGLNA